MRFRNVAEKDIGCKQITYYFSTGVELVRPTGWQLLVQAVCTRNTSSNQTAPGVENCNGIANMRPMNRSGDCQCTGGLAGPADRDFSNMSRQGAWQLQPKCSDHAFCPHPLMFSRVITTALLLNFFICRAPSHQEAAAAWCLLEAYVVQQR